jgi:hypothetical protein
VHSPLVGPLSWLPVAAALTSRGHEATVPDLTPAVAAGPPYLTRLVQAIAAAGSGAAATALIGHSRAGPLLAAAGGMLDQVDGYVFVDARLPAPGRSWLSTMPAGLVAELTARGHDGRLPPWPQWWGEAAMAELVPDPDVRRRFAAECRALPIAMLEETLPDAPRWPDAPAAYLRLSRAYDEQAQQARELGWPVRSMESHHLAPLTEPDRVAGALVDLMTQIGTVR